MKGPMIDRLVYLKTKESLSMDLPNPGLSVSEEFEKNILQSFHEPNDMPHYDDMEDVMNLLKALSNVTKLAVDEAKSTWDYIWEEQRSVLDEYKQAIKNQAEEIKILRKE